MVFEGAQVSKIQRFCIIFDGLSGSRIAKIRGFTKNVIKEVFIIEKIKLYLSYIF